MDDGKTNIQISTTLWKFLNDQKTKPNESFEAVITRLINKYQEAKQ